VARFSSTQRNPIHKITDPTQPPPGELVDPISNQTHTQPTPYIEKQSAYHKNNTPNCMQNEFACRYSIQSYIYTTCIFFVDLPFFETHDPTQTLKTKFRTNPTPWINPNPTTDNSAVKAASAKWPCRVGAWKLLTHSPLIESNSITLWAYLVNSADHVDSECRRRVSTDYSDYSKHEPETVGTV